MRDPELARNKKFQDFLLRKKRISLVAEIQMINENADIPDELVEEFKHED